MIFSFPTKCAMNAASLLIFFWVSWDYTNAFKQCCPGENIIVNKTCSDGSNVTSLPCKSRVLMGPTLDRAVTIEIDEDDELTITDESNSGYYLIEPEEYCITKESENGTDLALVCAADNHESTASVVLLYLKAVCAFTSVLFLLAILIIYLFVPGLRDIEGKCILNMIAPTCFGYIVYFFTPVFSLIQPTHCDVTGFMFFFSLLCCSSWLCVISFHLWRITIRPIFQTRLAWFGIYCCYGYGVPLVLLITALIQHLTKRTEVMVGETQCLFEGNTGIWAYFYGPATIMTVICVTLQFWAAKKVWIDIDRSDRSPSVVRLRKKSLMYLHLLLILGLIQVLDMISYIFFIGDSNLDYLWDLVDCRNFLVGGIMFFILVVLRNKVLKALGKNGLFCITFPKKWETLADEESEEVEHDETALTRDSTGL